MNILICENYKEMSQTASEIIAQDINNNPNITLGLATGSTPLGLYENLISMNENNTIDFSKIKTFNLDEYLGLNNEDEQSYNYFMKNNLFNNINIDKSNTHIPSGVADDIDLECQNYDRLIEDNGGIDVQILGIGSNAHIAFNEPSDTFKMGTYVVGLTESTIKANARFFSNIDDVPTKAITMGVGSIFKAKKIILLASGESKAQAIYDTIYGDIDPQTPSSILKLHPNATLIIDKESAVLLQD